MSSVFLQALDHEPASCSGFKPAAKTPVNKLTKDTYMDMALLDAQVKSTALVPEHLIPSQGHFKREESMLLETTVNYNRSIPIGPTGCSSERPVDMTLLDIDHGESLLGWECSTLDSTPQVPRTDATRSHGPPIKEDIPVIVNEFCSSGISQDAVSSLAVLDADFCKFLAATRNENQAALPFADKYSEHNLCSSLALEAHSSFRTCHPGVEIPAGIVHMERNDIDHYHVNNGGRKQFGDIDDDISLITAPIVAQYQGCQTNTPNSSVSSNVTNHESQIAADHGSDMNKQGSKETALAVRSTSDVIAELKHTNCYNLQKLENFKKLTASPEVELSTYPETKSEDVHESDTDSELPKDIGAVSNTYRISERRRVGHAIANSYFNRRAFDSVSASLLPREQDDHRQSTRLLIKESENENIISSPRDYQVELFERAKQKNIIAVLDTGSGKTLIAVLLLRHIIIQELEDRASGKPERISFFLVDSVSLVFQQYSVLDANLDHKIMMLYGDMNVKMNKESWGKSIAENRAIVCTAEILVQALHHSFISMNQINLLIFDEAHHAKKNHPYARIIKDFYSPMDPEMNPPKIFGMTASPVDARVDVRFAAAELEGLLHCEIATAADPSFMKHSIKSQVEEIATYASLGPSLTTPLLDEISTRFKDNPLFKKQIGYAHSATRELGVWCADQLWSFCLNERELQRSLAKLEWFNTEKKIQIPVTHIERMKTQVQDARKMIEAHDFGLPHYDLSTETSANLSSKVLVLVKYLKGRFACPTQDKCIVFVTQRYTARLLEMLFSYSHIGSQHLRVGALVGTSRGGPGASNNTFREQVLTLTKFRKGNLNCLFSTSVAEEGLDIPDCNLIIRFDLSDTLIKYIQSRGRARHANSKYVHMCERNNREHMQLIREVRSSEGILKRFCAELPADRKLLGNDFDMDYFLSKEKKHRVYIVKETGARLTYGVSLKVLANFVDSLPRSGNVSMIPEYVVTMRNKQFVCEVLLPEGSPIRRAIGKPASTKQVAKCSSAFEACVELRRGNYLDANLIPIFTKSVPIMRNAVLAVSSKKEEYDMRTKPLLWSVRDEEDFLYVTVLSLENPQYLERKSQPIAILTRRPMPHIPPFPLYLGPGKSSPVISIAINDPLHMAATLFQQITTFTLIVFKDVFSKEYEPNSSSMPYFMAPIVTDAAISVGSNAAELIDWKAIELVDKYEVGPFFIGLPWDQTTPDSFFEDKFISDPFDGSRKFWSVGVSHELKPLDPVPENTAPRPGTRKNNDNIMEYSCSLWEKARSRRKFREDQPVIECQLVSLRRNLLDEHDIVDEKPRKCFLIMEPLKISPLPTTVVAMVYLFPAIIHRIESYLIALDACTMLSLDIRPELALEAITKDSDNTDSNDETQINFQRGMGNNYERLEFLGDCFLKMATSISLYSILPDNDEFRYHVDRMLLICNKNLRNNAVKLKLYEYIRSKSFNRRVWYPEGPLLLKGKTAAVQKSHRLSDKTIADVCEALIGAALLSHRQSRNMDNAVRAVTELVCSENHRATCFADYYRLYKLPSYQTAPSTVAQRELATQVEAKHNYHFQYPRLLRSAFMHPSYPYVYEHVPSYQRLEFLGDALLDMVSVDFLFHNHPTRDPQWLTEHKEAMVSNQFYGYLAVRLGFHKHILYFHGDIQNQIQDYVTEIEDCRALAEEEAIKSGGSKEDVSPDFWMDAKRPPKCLPDVVEAYVGAIFVDSKYNYDEVLRFFDIHIAPSFQDMALYDRFANKHPSTLLMRFLNESMLCTNWKVYTKEMPSIAGEKTSVMALLMIHQTVICDEIAESGRYAKTKVCKAGMDILSGLPMADFRKRYRCDCRDQEENN